MNCENPKIIINRSLHWNDTLPIKLRVPCGKCESCRNSQRNDWFVRCYYEWLSHHTTTFFYTLTYNNENLPVYDGIPHFSKRDIQLFLKRFRKFLDGHYCKLKYIITCEYGDLKNRPHYHALFFLDRFIPPYVLYKIIEESWQYGFVKYGDDMGKVFTSAGIKYVTKYISKGFCLNDTLIPLLCAKVSQRYITFIQDYQHRYGRVFKSNIFYNEENGRFCARGLDFKLLSPDDVEYDFFSKIVSKCNSISLSRLPFHLQSTKLGLGFFDENARQKLDNGLVSILNNQAKPVTYRLPRYYKRLFFYDLVENETDGKRTKFVLNDEGKKHIISQLDLSIEKSRNNIDKVLSNVRLIHRDTLHLVNQVLPDKMCFGTVLELQYFLNRFDLDKDLMALYSSVYRFRYMPLELSKEPLTYDFLRDNYKDMVMYCLYHVSEHDYGKLFEKFGDISKQQAFSLMMWNEHPQLKVYEFACLVFDAVLVSVTRSISYASQEADENARKLREFMRNL